MVWMISLVIKMCFIAFFVCVGKTPEFCSCFRFIYYFIYEDLFQIMSFTLVLSTDSIKSKHNLEKDSQFEKLKAYKNLRYIFWLFLTSADGDCMTVSDLLVLSFIGGLCFHLLWKLLPLFFKLNAPSELKWT